MTIRDDHFASFEGGEVSFSDFGPVFHKCYRGNVGWILFLFYIFTRINYSILGLL